MSGLLERLATGPPVLMDGAMSTELAARGFKFNEREWLRVNLDAPEVVAEVHASYAQAGAELHIANSFATARHVTEHYGFGGSFAALNRAAVSLCRAAVEAAGAAPQWVAGSISTYAPNHDRNRLPSLKRLEANCREQASILADAGCDLIALEMVADTQTGAALLRGAAEPGLPISLGLVCARSAEGEIGLYHSSIGAEPLASGLPRLLEHAPEESSLIVSVMHTDVADTPAALDEVRQFWSGAVGVYPHVGRPDGAGGWDLGEAAGATEFVAACEASIDRGACFVGGCCGIGPDAIRSLAKQLERRAMNGPANT